MPSVLSILPEYKGLTSEEISKMYSAYNSGLEKAREEQDSTYEKYGEQYTQLGALKAALDKYSNNESDKQYIDAYNNYVDRLQNSVNDMIQNGYSTRTARDLAFLRGEYNFISSTVGNAEAARNNAINEYYNKINSGNYISTYDPTTSTLNDYMSDSPKRAFYADLDKVYKAASAIAAAYSAKNYDLVFGSEEYDIGDNKYGVVTNTQGYKNLDIENDNFLNKQIDSILMQQGITLKNGFSDEQINQAKKVIYAGYRDGVGYAETPYVKEIGLSDSKKIEKEKEEEEKKDKEKEEEEKKDKEKEEEEKKDKAFDIKELITLDSNKYYGRRGDKNEGRSPWGISLDGNFTTKSYNDVLPDFVKDVANDCKDIFDELDSADDGYNFRNGINVKKSGESYIVTIADGTENTFNEKKICMIIIKNVLREDGYLIEQ